MHTNTGKNVSQIEHPAMYITDTDTNCIIIQSKRAVSRLGSISEVLCMCHVKCTRKPFMTCKTKSINSMGLLSSVLYVFFLFAVKKYTPRKRKTKKGKILQTKCLSFDCPNEITFGFIQQTLIAYRTPVNHKMTIIIGSFDFIARSCEKIIYAAEQIFIVTKQETRTKNTTVT